MADSRTIVFFPEGAFGPTNNCVGIGNVLRERGHRVVFIVEESFAGTLEARGFEERLMRLGPAPAEPEVPGQFWIDFIRDTAPVFRKTHARAARRVHGADLAGAHRRVDVRRRAAARDHRRARAGRRRRGQRRRVRGTPGERPAVGPHRVVQPGRAQGPGRAAVLVRLSGGGRDGLAGRSSTRSGAPTATCGPRSTPGSASTARPAWPTGRRVRTSCSSRRTSTCTSTRPRPTTSGAGRSGRPGTAWTRASARPRRHVVAAGGAGRPARAPHLPVARQPRLGRRGAHAAARRRARPDRPSGHRQQGPAGRPDPAPRQHDGGGVPAPAGDPAAGRPRHHPRRQQHGHRGVPPRQADGRPAAVLGPGRQRPAGRRDRASASACRRTTSPTRS